MSELRHCNNKRSHKNTNRNKKMDDSEVGSQAARESYSEPEALVHRQRYKASQKVDDWRGWEKVAGGKPKRAPAVDAETQ